MNHFETFFNELKLFALKTLERVVNHTDEKVTAQVLRAIQYNLYIRGGPIELEVANVQ